jgi:hypothetical protein
MIRWLAANEDSTGMLVAVNINIKHHTQRSALFYFLNFFLRQW